MKRSAIFAHYDGQGEVKPYVLTLLRGLREVCDEIFFVSTAQLSDSELQKVNFCCSRAELRANAGFDFGMWQHALAALDLTSVDELVLTNSSVFGPIYPLAPIFARMAEEACDFWGMTDNFEIRWHVQSYFLVLKKRALSFSGFSRFFSAVLPYRDKDQVIRSYELGLTQFLCEGGLRPAAFVPVASWLSSPIRKARLCAQRRNSTLYHPEALLAAGMPFVKAQLLRDNPARISLTRVLAAMQATGYDMSSIQFDRPPPERRSWLAAAREAVSGTRIQSQRPKV